MDAAGAVGRAGELVRWAAFGCALVPLVLLSCGSSPARALGTGGGIALVTAVCRALLRHCERGAARPDPHGSTGPHRGRHGRTGTGAHRGGRRHP
ncbi:hypothetical protein F0L17_08460 [Streptomyces sp. TRM43335]|uniref:Uncharacterized protein n=1 Tax=Streptomyces taklimakanensis TaxID=2569853 RepID=A0A6G2BA76_9ACTN|nr:hypothetical protein [Streptomyces taklimakanensis]MTE19160.1 hypothetical protein [Streptomyces taklimakanensis]